MGSILPARLSRLFLEEKPHSGIKIWEGLGGAQAPSTEALDIGANLSVGRAQTEPRACALPLQMISFSMRLPWNFLVPLCLTVSVPPMSQYTCPECEMSDVLEFPDHLECVTCGHEWTRPAESEPTRVVKDAHGNVLADGDCVILIKDLPLKGSLVLKGGTKTKPIRLGAGDHEISCKIDGMSIGLKACFVKKA